MIPSSLKKHYKGQGWGKNLYEAIFNDGNRYNPRVVDDWIESQAKSYMEPEWDDEWKEMSTPCEKCRHLPYKESREHWAYERASDDFDCFFHDISDKYDDEEVACFFGIKVEIDGYMDEDGEEFDTNGILCFCSNCERPIYKDDLFVFNEDRLKMFLTESTNGNLEKEYVGMCKHCEDVILASEIKNDEDLRFILEV